MKFSLTMLKWGFSPSHYFSNCGALAKLASHLLIKKNTVPLVSIKAWETFLKQTWLCSICHIVIFDNLDNAHSSLMHEVQLLFSQIWPVGFLVCECWCHIVMTAIVSKFVSLVVTCLLWSSIKASLSFCLFRGLFLGLRSWLCITHMLRTVTMWQIIFTFLRVHICHHMLEMQHWHLGTHRLFFICANGVLHKQC